jgi:hypothetical protein
MNIVSDSSASPSTVRASCEGNFPSGVGYGSSIFSPVRKGDYYEITIAYGTFSSGWFIPIGS